MNLKTPFLLSFLAAFPPLWSFPRVHPIGFNLAAAILSQPEDYCTELDST